jgi:L-malate glycosyltransferase
LEYYHLQGKVTVNDYNSDIDRLWDSHHVLILPSIAEGTPLSLQEAMLKGRPALVTDVGGNAALITDGGNGFVASSPTALCLTLKLKELLGTDLEKLEKMGQAAYTKACEAIDLDSAQRILEQLEGA